MTKVLLVFWPEKGNVDSAGDKIANLFSGVEVKKVSVSLLQKTDLEKYDNWIVGGSTSGAHVWEDADDSNRWFEFFKLLKDIDMKNKVVAFYGLGDQVLYPQHFLDGLGFFQDEFQKYSIHIVGRWPVSGYEFYESEGMKDEHFFGLALDEDNQEEMTEERISRWIELIRKDFK